MVDSKTIRFGKLSGLVFAATGLVNAGVAGFLLAGAAVATAQPNVVSPEEAAEGFVNLFDGTREGFQFVDYVQNDATSEMLDEAWILDPVEAAMATQGTANDLRSKVTYKDFDFRFDYKNDGDAGAFYRFTLDYQWPWVSGPEVPIDPNGAFCKACAGGVLDMYEPNILSLHPYEDPNWNSMRIVVIGDSVEHWVNGVQSVGYRFHSEDFWTRFDQSKWVSFGNSMSMKVAGDRAGGYIEEGYVGFQGLAGGRWLLRNVRINPTAPKFGPPSTPVSLRRAATAPGRASLLRGEVRGHVLLPAGGLVRTLDGRARPPMATSR